MPTSYIKGKGILQILKTFITVAIDNKKKMKENPNGSKQCGMKTKTLS